MVVWFKAAISIFMLLGFLRIHFLGSWGMLEWSESQLTRESENDIVILEQFYTWHLLWWWCSLLQCVRNGSIPKHASTYKVD